MARLIAERVAAYEKARPRQMEIGQIIQVGDGVAIASGLENVQSEELLRIRTKEGDVMAMALSLQQDSVGMVLFGTDEMVAEMDIVERTGEVMQVPVGEALLGRVVNPIGIALDGKGNIDTGLFGLLDVKAPGVVERQPVKEPLQTGIIAVDSMMPIGRGQRELVIGDRQTGKTAIAIDAILNQRDTDVICVYIAVGQKRNFVRMTQERLQSAGVMNKTILVYTAPDDPAALLYVAPYAGCAMAEYFQKKGGHVLVIYDDLTRHAQAYRQMSLVLQRPAGREAYPGDIFYLHSRLLERASKLNDTLGGGSITALPIIETLEGDISAYIPTNVISITDGQIYLEPKLFNAGIRPAINVGLSVSRVGGAAQLGPMKKVVGMLRMQMARYRELAEFARMGEEQLDASARRTLARGKRLQELLKQPQYQPIPVGEQVILIAAGNRGIFDKVPVELVVDEGMNLRLFARQNFKDLLNILNAKTSWSDDELKNLMNVDLPKVFEEFQAELEKRRRNEH
ncbi:F0F1 ATP synthase subunit alpha [bacterium]|nr:F0F1 ATP synthase subunit alpha [candidate division CSSED10-310 bacterium]